jgi:hypothetical protein
MPPQLSNRAADNWGPDALGRGVEAREAAIALSASRSEDLRVVLLTTFDQKGSDRIWGTELLETLWELDDAPWTEFRGLRDDGTPHKLRQGELAAMLRSFGIRSKSIWPAHRAPGISSRKGYLREHFEEVWHAYCPAAGTPAHPGKIPYLNRP